LDRFSGPAKVRPEAVQLRVIRVVLALARGLDIVSVARKSQTPKPGVIGRPIRSGRGFNNGGIQRTLLLCVSVRRWQKTRAYKIFEPA
jgi:hypothetical protein